MKKISEDILKSNREDLLRALLTVFKENPLEKNQKIKDRKDYRDISFLLSCDAKQIINDSAPIVMKRFDSFIKMCENYPEFCDENKKINKEFMTQYIAELYFEGLNNSYGGVVGNLFLAALNLSKYDIKFEDVDSALSRYKQQTFSTKEISQENESNPRKK